MGKPKSRWGGGWLAIVVVFGLITSGCSGDSGDSQKGTGATKGQRPPQERVERFEKFLRDNGAERERLVAEKTVACMDAAGFGGLLRVIPRAPVDAPEATSTWSFVADIDSNSPVSSGMLQESRPLDANERRALAGDVPDATDDESAGATFGAGCIGQAMASVYVDAAVWEAFTEHLAQAEGAVEEDPEVVVATRAWAECFERLTGVIAGSPHDAQMKLRQEVEARLSGVPTEVASQAEADAWTAALNELKETEAKWSAADRQCTDPDLISARAAARITALTGLLTKHGELLKKVGFHE